MAIGSGWLSFTRLSRWSGDIAYVWRLVGRQLLLKAWTPIFRCGLLSAKWFTCRRMLFSQKWPRTWHFNTFTPRINTPRTKLNSIAYDEMNDFDSNEKTFTKSITRSSWLVKQLGVYRLYGINWNKSNNLDQVKGCLWSMPNAENTKILFDKQNEKKNECCCLQVSEVVVVVVFTYKKKVSQPINPFCYWIRWALDKHIRYDGWAMINPANIYFTM